MTFEGVYGIFLIIDGSAWVFTLFDGMIFDWFVVFLWLLTGLDGV